MPSPDETKRMIDEELRRRLKIGDSIYCDPANGNDAYHGASVSNAVASLDRALALCTAGKNDTVYLISDGQSTGTARLSAQLAWNKDATHLVGICAPTGISQRARISHASTAPTTVFTPMVLVTGDGCIFQNVQIFEGFDNAADEVVTWEDQGERNYYENVHFAGMGSDGDTADDAASACLLLTGGGEHRFNHCTYGVDTVARGAANASVRLRSATARNVFEDCLFLTYADAATPLQIDANAANSLGRFAFFKRCAFLNTQNVGGATALTVVGVGHANQNGTIFLEGCSFNNFTDVAADGALIKLSNSPVVADTDTAGSFLNANAT